MRIVEKYTTEVNKTPKSLPIAKTPRHAMEELTQTFPQWLHRLIQAFFDWVTGYYLYPPLWQSSPSLELLYGISQYFGGLGLVILAFTLSYWLLLPVGYWLSVAGAAAIQEVTHFLCHETFFNRSQSIKERKNHD